VKHGKNVAEDKFVTHSQRHMSYRPVYCI